jgi:hypothetical protein
MIHWCFINFIWYTKLKGLYNDKFENTSQINIQKLSASNFLINKLCIYFSMNCFKMLTGVEHTLKIEWNKSKLIKYPKMLRNFVTFIILLNCGNHCTI